MRKLAHIEKIIDTPIPVIFGNKGEFLLNGENGIISSNLLKTSIRQKSNYGITGEMLQVGHQLLYNTDGRLRNLTYHREYDALISQDISAFYPKYIHGSFVKRFKWIKKPFNILIGLLGSGEIFAITTDLGKMFSVTRLDFRFPVTHIEQHDNKLLVIFEKDGDHHCGEVDFSEWSKDTLDLVETATADTTPNREYYKEINGEWTITSEDIEVGDRVAEIVDSELETSDLQVQVDNTMSLGMIKRVGNIDLIIADGDTFEVGQKGQHLNTARNLQQKLELEIGGSYDKLGRIIITTNSPKQLHIGGIFADVELLTGLE